MAAEYFLRFENFQPGIVLEKRLEEAATGSGAEEFLEALAAPTATPGGGGAAAAAAAMAAALGAMISGLMKRDTSTFETERRFLTAAIERDAQAYRGVMAAYRIPKADRAGALEAALQQAAVVPMEVAEHVAFVKTQLETLQREAPTKYSSDIETGLALARAALQGTTANVRVNCDSITTNDFKRALEQRLAALT